MQIKIDPKLSDRRDKNNQSGQSLVEFAVSLVFLLVLIAGAVDVSRAYFTYMALRDAAQEGALYGSINPDDTGGITARVQQASNMLADMGGSAIVSITYEDPTYHCNGYGITVKAELAAFPLAMPLIGAFIGGQTIPIGAEATDTILVPPCP